MIKLFVNWHIIFKKLPTPVIQYSISRLMYNLSMKIISYSIVLVYTDSCGANLIAPLTYETISTPNFPAHYKSNLLCTWTIKPPDHHLIQFNVISVSSDNHNEVLQVNTYFVSWFLIPFQIYVFIFALCMFEFLLISISITGHLLFY